MHLFYVLGLEVDEVVLLANTFGRGVMGCGNKAVAGWTLFQARETIEDATTAIVQQENTEITPKVLVPQRILVVEETQVADDTEDLLVSDDRETSGCREGTLDAVDTAITPYVVAGVDVGQADGSAVSVVDGG